MSALEKLARAEVSSDLKHYDRPCDVDTLTAAGMAAVKHLPHLSVFRLKFLNDATEMAAAKAIFIRWAFFSLQRRKLNPQMANRVGVKALAAWLDDVCHSCRGVRFQAITGTPSLSDKSCPCCNGTGKQPIRVERDLLDVLKDCHERADDACQTIRRGMDAKMER